MPLAQARLAQVSVNAREIRRATAFYRDTLGMKHLFDAPPAMSFFDCGGVRLMLAVPEKPEFDHASSVLYFEVEDIDQAYRELVSQGVRFRDQPHFVAPLGNRELWMSFFEDGEGNVLAITAQKAKGPGCG